jgi:hypothetical protein
MQMTVSPGEAVADLQRAAHIVRVSKVEQVLGVQAAHPAAVSTLQQLGVANLLL